MRLDLIAEYLEGEGVGTRGRDLFINFIPQDASGILLRDNFGGTRYDHELPGYMRGDFMLITRAPDYETAKNLIDLARQTLRRLPGLAQDTVSWKRVLPVRTPFPYQPSPGGNIEFAQNIDCVYVDTAELAG
jgi:hypothetical protein